VLREDNSALNDRDDSALDASSKKILANKASFLINPLQDDLARPADDREQLLFNSPSKASNLQFGLKIGHDSPRSHQNFNDTLFLNQSSTCNMLPQLSRHESEVQSLRHATMRVDQIEGTQRRILPKIVLLSQHKNKFEGLVIPSEEDENVERRENAKHIRSQLN